MGGAERGVVRATGKGGGRATRSSRGVERELTDWAGRGGERRGEAPPTG